MPDDLGDIFAAVEAEASGGEGSSEDTPVTEPSGIEEGTDETTASLDLEDDGIETSDTQDAGTEVEFDWQQYADQPIPLMVDGQEVTMTLAELRNGGMRQADYTRKTQELAAKAELATWAQDVQAAFDRDPAGTLEAFAKAYNLSPGAKQDMKDALEDLDEDIRPWVEQTQQMRTELEATKRQLASLSQDRVLEDVRAEVRSLQDRYGKDFDTAGALQLAAAKNITLEDAHFLLAGQRGISVKQATSKATVDQQAKAEADRLAAKKAASTTTTKSFKASDIPADDFNDIGELMEQIIASGS